MRIFIAVRHRVAEEAVARHVASGTRQVIVLGAGLDTFAYRNPFADSGVRVFEVDHPATQEWKRDTLARTGIPIPDSVVYAPVDFEADDLASRMAASGVDLARADVLPLARRRPVPHPRGGRRDAAGGGGRAGCRGRVRLSQPGRPALGPEPRGAPGSRRPDAAAGRTRGSPTSTPTSSPTTWPDSACTSRMTSAPTRSACAGSVARPTRRPAAAPTSSWPLRARTPPRPSGPAAPAPCRRSRPRLRRGRCP